MLLKSLKTLLGFGLLGFVGVWIGCSSDASPVAPHPAGKTHLTLTSPTDSDGDGIPDADSTQTDADSDGDGIPDADSTQTYVTFADSSLERAVGEALVAAFIFPQVPARGSITVANMRRLTTLDASGRGITSLAGLDYATNLDTLNLRENSITDVSPLSSLTNLKWLSLRENSITALGPLSSLTNLKWLNLRENRITDISPLAGLTGLKHLDLYINPLTGLDPLAALTNLEGLAIGNNDLDGDIGPVASLTGLKWLKINAFGLRDSELKTLAHALTDLEDLNISANGHLTDFEPLTCLTKLKVLQMRSMARLFEINAEGNRVPKPKQIHLLYLEKRGVLILNSH